MVVCLHQLRTPHPDMTVVSNDPSWLPFITVTIFSSYFTVVSFVAVLYDWGERNNTFRGYYNCDIDIYMAFKH